MSILDHFDRRNGRKPRKEQAEALLAVEEGWDDHDIIVVIAPTGAGKTLLGDCIAQWQASKGKRTHVLVPDNALLDQAAKEAAKESKVMLAQRFYPCTWKGLDERPVTGTRANCPNKTCKVKFTARCPYTRALNLWQKSYVRVANYWLPGALKMVDKCDVVIFDEAHKLYQFAQGLCAKRIWRHDLEYPLEAQSYGEIKQWCKTQLAAWDWVTREDKQWHAKLELEILWKELSTDCGKYTVTATEAEYRGEKLPCLQLQPIDVRDALPLYLNRKTTKKIVLMTATLSKNDLDDIGLANNKTLYVEVGSPIPADRRPVYIRPVVSNKITEGFKDLQELMTLIDACSKKYPNDSGIVHVTYSLSKAMQKSVIPEDIKSRLIFHTPHNKQQKLKEFCENRGKILIGCGMCEGIDLKYDLARWAIVAKIPWKSLADPVVARKAEEDPDWYLWQAARDVMQSCGRICRAADDFGCTYVIDASFQRIPKRLLLRWFLDGCHWD